jgi:hypothetical protein
MVPACQRHVGWRKPEACLTLTRRRRYWAAAEPFIPPPLAPGQGSGPGRRAGGSRPASAACGGGDPADPFAAPLGDAVEPGGLLAASREPLGGLDRGPAHQPGALVGDRATAHVVSDWRWRGVSPAQEHRCGALANRWTSPVSAAKRAASTGPAPGMAWSARCRWRAGVGAEDGEACGQPGGCRCGGDAQWSGELVRESKARHVTR